MVTREDLFTLLDAREYMWGIASAEIAGFFPTAMEEVKHFIATKHNITAGEVKNLLYVPDTDAIEIWGYAANRGEFSISIPVEILTLSSGDGGEGVVTNYLNVTPSAFGDMSGPKPTSDVRRALEEMHRVYPDMFIDYDRLEEVEEELKDGTKFRGFYSGAMQ